MNGDNFSIKPPLFVLQPVCDADHAWVAMSIDSPRPLAADVVAHLFNELNLAETLDRLPCLITCDQPATYASLTKHASQIILRVPGAIAKASVTEASELGALRQAGFGLVAERAGGEAGNGLMEAYSTDLKGFLFDCADCDWKNVEKHLKIRDGCHIAQGVGTYPILDQCKSAGFSWFAGNYGLTTQPGQATRNSTRQALLLRLLNMITQDGDSPAVEKLIKQDAQLSYQLLRLVNSVAFSFNRNISSFTQALTLLGRRQLQRWLQLLIYAHPNASTRSVLLPRAAYRAALMDQLCGNKNAETRERAFMVGMFSLLDVMLGTPLADTLAQLHLAEDVNAALLHRHGLFGLLLTAIEHAEHSRHTGLADALGKVAIDHATWVKAMLSASNWAIRLSKDA